MQPALFREERRSVGLAFIGGTFMFFPGCVGYMLVFRSRSAFLTEYQAEHVDRQPDLADLLHGEFP